MRGWAAIFGDRRSQRKAPELGPGARLEHDHLARGSDEMARFDQISGGAVEGFGHKAKLTFRKAHGFRSFSVSETALYHTLGKRPEPDFIHRFF